MNYTFNELIKKYDWDIKNKNLSSKERKLSFAYRNGVVIEPIGNNGKQDLFIIRKELHCKLYSWKELYERYDWRDVRSKPQRLSYAKIRGVILKEHPYQRYEIVEDYSDRVMTWNEIINKYGFQQEVRSLAEEKLKYCKRRGLEIEYLGNSNGTAYYYIKDSAIIDNMWYESELYPELEVSKEGNIRSKNTKILYTSTSSQDYIDVPANGHRERAHRVIMKIFNPIEEPEKFVVDHINGIRTDNRLENLRWVTDEQNKKLKDENRLPIQQKINYLIAKYGYDDTLKLLNTLK